MTRYFPQRKFFFAWSNSNDPSLLDGGEINAKQFFRDLDFPPWICDNFNILTRHAW